MDALFIIVPILIIGTFLFIIISIITRWHKNNNSPRLTVEATIVAKRTQVSANHTFDGNMTSISNYTSYYVTFQVVSGDRLELHVNSSEYGHLVEGDEGKLTFQGTRYLGFERTLPET